MDHGCKINRQALKELAVLPDAVTLSSLNRCLLWPMININRDIRIPIACESFGCEALAANVRKVMVKLAAI